MLSMSTATYGRSLGARVWFWNWAHSLLHLAWQSWVLEHRAK